MALLTCPECTHLVSDQAALCPQCGRPMEGNTPQRVQTSEDAFLTRSRGFGDLVLFGPLFVIGVILIVLFVRTFH